MYPLGLPAIDRDKYLRHLQDSHVVNFRVQIMNLDHAYMANISDAVIDGQVTVDWNGDIATRTCVVALFDPTFDLGFDTSQHADGVWFYDRMIQVVAEVFVPELGRVISCPMFTGPVRNVKRSGSVVTVTCDGKDVFARKSWPRLKLAKGTNVIDGIVQVLTELGETFFRIEATTTAKIAADRYIDRSMDMTPMGYLRIMAGTVGCRLFYAGDGYATIRAKDESGPPVFTFRDDEGGSILTRPDTGGDYSNIANIVRAESIPTTGKPKFYEATVDKSSPIHPSELKRGGKPLYMGVVVERDTIRTTDDAKTVAKRELADRQFAVYETAFDSLPIFPLEEGDLVGVVAEGIATTTPLLRFAFGLSPKAVMPVGYRKLVAPTVARIQRKG